MQIKNYSSKPLLPLFYLYAALNYNGYDQENNKKGMHPFRQKMRNYLKKQSAPKFDFCFHPYQYTKEILTTSGLIPSSETNPNFIPAIEYIQKFIKETNLKKLEKDFIIETENAIEPYKNIFPSIFKITDEFFEFQPQIQELIFTVNLLESYYRGFSIQMEKTGYLITGPSNSPNLRNLLHEMIHFYVNDIDAPQIPKDTIQQIPKEIINNYGNSLLSESFIRALVIYLLEKNNVLPKQKLNFKDISMIYPQKFLELLNKKSINRLTKNQVKNLLNEIIS